MPVACGLCCGFFSIIAPPSNSTRSSGPRISASTSRSYSTRVHFRNCTSIGASVRPVRPYAQCIGRWRFTATRGSRGTPAPGMLAGSTCGRCRRRRATALFERTWGKRCSGVVTSLREGGEELLTFFRFPKEQWKTLRTTNTIERLHEEFRRRVKTQSSLPTEDSAVVLLLSLVASGPLRLRRVDGWQKIATVLSQNTSVAA